LEDGNTWSFRNVVFSSPYNPGRWSQSRNWVLRTSTSCFVSCHWPQRLQAESSISWQHRQSVSLVNLAAEWQRHGTVTSKEERYALSISVLIYSEAISVSHPMDYDGYFQEGKSSAAWN
jgi:hypothetical protein